MTTNGYDELWVRAINHVLQDRDATVRIKDINDDIWENFIGPMIDEIEIREYHEGIYRKLGHSAGR